MRACHILALRAYVLLKLRIPIAMLILDQFAYSNPIEGDYQRKHNLLARFESIRLNPHRISRVKNLTLFV